MKCNNCNKPKYDCDCDPCGCDPCGPAPYGCDFSMDVSPYDPHTWIARFNGCTTKFKAPKLAETCTALSTDSATANLVFKGECSTQTITGKQLGDLINIGDLRDTNVSTPESGQFLVYNPHCDDECADCRKIDAKWENYSIPDAGDCIIEQDGGYYNVLVKDECGLIKECRLPVVGDLNAITCYVRDSVPDDPDWPWYYGCYNEDIQLYLSQNASKYFGVYDLEVTVNYGIQTVKSSASKNVNFRSLVIPVVQGETPDAEHMSCILQNNNTYSPSSKEDIPWGTVSLRGSFTFIVPKGKEAYLHHEFRLRDNASFPDYYFSQYDGQRVPTAVAGRFDQMVHNASRLNALQVIVRPAFGYTNKSPVIDVARDQLDAPVDVYPNPITRS